MPSKTLDGRLSGALTDAELVEAAQQGDADAISELLERSHVRVRRFAHLLCSTPEDAEEAAQEALIILYRKVGTLRVAAALGAWLFEITRRECIRRSRIALRVHLSPTDCEASAEDVAVARLELQRIAGSIARLESEQRAVLVLRDVHGLSGAATAERLGVSRAAMKSRLHRAREQLRSQLAAG